MLYCTLDTWFGCQPPTDRSNRKEWIGLGYDDMIRNSRDVIHNHTLITESQRMCHYLKMFCKSSSRCESLSRYSPFSTFSLISVMIVYVVLIRILECDLRKWEGSLRDRHRHAALSALASPVRISQLRLRVISPIYHFLIKI